MNETTMQRFMAKISPEAATGCWLWTGCVTNCGYGLIYTGKKCESAHRISYKLFNGPLPEGKPFVCHRCDVRSCVNPSHLFAGSIQDNMDDMVAKGRARSIHKDKTHCKHGHPLSGDNMYIRANGARICRACTRRRAAAYIASRKVSP